MALLGFLLLLCGVAAGVVGIWMALVDGTNPPQWAAALNFEVLQGPMTMFLLGAGSVLFILLGFALISSATKRKVRTAKERRDLEKRQKLQEKELAETRARLDREQTSRPAPAAAPGHRDGRHDDRPVDRRDDGGAHAAGRPGDPLR